ncbi:MAG: formate--tetrahydrofolate ligase [Myxococcales bacterium]|nr:formate--tetrahydrofolate ligase [Myxococcales bacterium]
MHDDASGVEAGDLELARAVTPRPIEAIAEQLGLGPEMLECYGRDKAKLRLGALPPAERRGKLILVTSTTPTRAGTGKTVTAIGLGQGLGKVGVSHAVCLREPSLGPVFGLKGGATGGGRAQLLPMEEINLHFTGDLHAVTSAHNLLSALIDNRLHFEHRGTDRMPEIHWPRALDVCDRQLRNCEIGLGAPADGFAHRAEFLITAASEVMAVLALARNLPDLKRRLAAMVVGYDHEGRVLRSVDFEADGAMAVLLERALWPNLVQTLEHTPALVHAGPFANIAHGCSSVVATRLALGRADYVVSEAGFGADLGAEKFMHIKCRQAGLWPSAAVVVASCPSLRRHGDADLRRLSEPDLPALRRGLDNLRAHLDIVARFGVPAVVAINERAGDSAAEHDAIAAACAERGVTAVLCQAHGRGGEGGVALAQAVIGVCEGHRESEPRYLYGLGDCLRTKIERVASEVYGADGVDYAPGAERALERIERLGFGELPICVAKTQLSISDDPRLRGVPRGFRLQVGDAQVSAGAGFVVVFTGNTVRMPGLPRHPAAHGIGFDTEGRIRGLR